MDRIETPKEFAERLFDSPTLEQDAKLIATRDALLHADERQKAAGNWEAFARKIWGSNRVMDVEQFVLEGKAAIMAEPEKGTK